MRQDYSQSHFFKPKQLLRRLAPGPDTPPAISPGQHKDIPQNPVEKPKTDESKESTHDQMERLKAQLEAERKAYERVDKLIEERKEQIKTFIEARSQADLKYKAGDWEQWNKDFLEAIGNPDPKQINIRLIQTVIFKKLKLQGDTQGRKEDGRLDGYNFASGIDGRLGPYSLVAMAIYLGVDLPHFVYLKSGQSAIDPVVIGEKGELQPALTTVAQQYQAEKNLAHADSIPEYKPDPSSEINFHSAFDDFSTHEAAPITVEIAGKKKADLDRLEAIKAQLEGEGEISNWTGLEFEKTIFNNAAHDYERAYKEFVVATEANSGFIEAEQNKILVYNKLQKAINSYYDMQEAANQDAQRDYQTRLEKIAEPYDLPSGIKLNEFYSAETFNAHPIVIDLLKKAPTMAFLNKYLIETGAQDQDGKLPLRKVSGPEDLKKYMRGVDEAEQIAVAEKLWKALKEAGYYPPKGINDQIYLHNLKRFSAQHGNLWDEVRAQRQAATDHIKTLSLEELSS